MLSYFAASVAGQSHAARGIPCQDAYATRRAGEFVVAVVADGVGSDMRSDLASATASRICADVIACALRASDRPPDVPPIIEAGMRSAAGAVGDVARGLGEAGGDQYGTTLLATVFDGDHAWWGMAGDGGLLVAERTGRYRVATEQQRDEEGRVFTLQIPHRWRFGREDGVASVALVTDGMLDFLSPALLRLHGGAQVYARMARMFLDPGGGAANSRRASGELAAFLKANEELLPDDDKTLVAVFDPTRPPARLEDACYAEPDWDALTAAAQRRHEELLAQASGEDDARADTCRRVCKEAP